MSKSGEDRRNAILKVLKDSNNAGLTLYEITLQVLKNEGVDTNTVPYKTFVSRTGNTRYHLIGYNTASGFTRNQKRNLVACGLVKTKKRGSETIYFVVNKQTAKAQDTAR